MKSPARKLSEARYRKKHAEQLREYSRKWYREHAAQRREYGLAYRKKNAVRLREKDRARRGIPAPTYKAPAECEGCLRKVKLCADHNHATGKFRGWLCCSCNFAISHARDEPKTLNRLASYVRSRGR